MEKLASSSKERMGWSEIHSRHRMVGIWRISRRPSRTTSGSWRISNPFQVSLTKAQLADNLDEVSRTPCPLRPGSNVEPRSPAQETRLRMVGTTKKSMETKSLV